MLLTCFLREIRLSRWSERRLHALWQPGYCKSVYTHNRSVIRFLLCFWRPRCPLEGQGHCDLISVPFLPTLRLMEGILLHLTQMTTWSDSSGQTNSSFTEAVIRVFAACLCQSSERKTSRQTTELLFITLQSYGPLCVSFNINQTYFMSSHLSM